METGTASTATCAAGSGRGVRREGEGEVASGLGTRVSFPESRCLLTQGGVVFTTLF